MSGGDEAPRVLQLPVIAPGDLRQQALPHPTLRRETPTQCSKTTQ
jgi:hypothetical protein